jgi:hypothetical protein
MITVNGKDHPTIADAAKRWSVTPKTVRDWIEKGVIPKPPTVKKGLRRIQVFPTDFIGRAEVAMDAWEKRRRGG